jgi:hypothetical protein
VLGFTPRDFVIFGLPYKNPKTSLFVRRNGALTFTITGGTHGVPYAQDRLLVIWLATVFWKENDTRQPNQYTPWPNVLVYDPVFANDIRTGAIPTDFQSVLALSDNMGPLSLYQFEAHSSYLHARLGKADRVVPVLGSSGLLVQIGCNVREADTRKARATIRHWHGIVKRLWPDCPNELARGDTILIVWAGYAIKHGRLPAPEDFGVGPLDRLGLERMREGAQRAGIIRERALLRKQNEPPRWPDMNRLAVPRPS